MIEIVNANTPYALDELWGYIEQMPKTKVIDLALLKSWLCTSIGTEVFNAWIAYDGEKMAGFIVAELTDEPAVYIAFCWIQPQMDCGKDLLGKVEQWAMDNNIHKIMFDVYRSPTPYIKKYGFSLRMAQLEKEI